MAAALARPSLHEVAHAAGGVVDHDRLDLRVARRRSGGTARARPRARPRGGWRRARVPAGRSGSARRAAASPPRCAAATPTAGRSSRGSSPRSEFSIGSSPRSASPEPTASNSASKLGRCSRRTSSPRSCRAAAWLNDPASPWMATVSMFISKNLPGPPLRKARKSRKARPGLLGSGPLCGHFRLGRPATSCPHPLRWSR